MKQVDLFNRFREGLAQLSLEIEAAVSAGHFDIASISENLIKGLFRELFGLRHIRNLNDTDRFNFPGIDLIDENARVGVQVTATPTLEKIKTTLETCKRHGIDGRIDRLIIYVLTRRQDTYSQSAINGIGAKFRFDAKSDILDFRDLAALAGRADPAILSSAIDVLDSYQKGVPAGLSELDFDPPKGPTEVATLNMLALYVPSKVFIADLVDIGMSYGARRKGQRNAVRAYAEGLGVRLPSDYMVSEGKLITFHALDEDRNPFEKIVDAGTITPLLSREYWEINVDHERIFKGLLRFSLQQKLYRHVVKWFHDEELFVFLPKENPDIRTESWVGKVQATRTVFIRKMNKKDESKTFVCKHLAFGADFYVSRGAWFIAIAPDWYFSHGDDFRRSLYADKSLAWLKRRETNRIVFDHFRFLSAWLKDLDQDDLFSQAVAGSPGIAFGDPASFSNHPPLNDDEWLPVRGGIDGDAEGVAGLFEEI